MPDMSNQCHDPDDDDRRDMSITFDYSGSCRLLGGVGIIGGINRLFGHLSGVVDHFFRTFFIFLEFTDIKLMLE